MRTARQCHAMADRMERYAALDESARLQAEWRTMAVYWRDLAHQSAWQDAWAATRL